MLHMTQKLIRASQVVKFFAADVELVMQLLQRTQRSTRPQPGLCASINSLQTLHQELDVANASRVNFDVNTFIRLLESCSVLAPLVHFLSRHQSRFDRGKIHLLGVNMWLHRTDEFARQAGLS